MGKIPFGSYNIADADIKQSTVIRLIEAVALMRNYKTLVSGTASSAAGLLKYDLDYRLKDF